MSRNIPEPRSLHDLVGTNTLVHYRDFAALAGIHYKTFQKRALDTGLLQYVRPSPRKLLVPTKQLTPELVEGILQFASTMQEFRAAQVVYFIRAGEDGPIKIGIAGDIDRRLFELQNQHWIELRVIATRPGGLTLERQLHRQFAAHRIRGEWFLPHPDILAEIERLAA